MAIREQGYRHWDGEYTGHTTRWWTVAKFGIRASVHSKLRLYFVTSIPIGAILFPVALTLFLYNPTQGAGFERQHFLMMFGFQGLIIAVLGAVVGSGLIANDMGSNALHIYLSKSMRRIDYILGKAAVLVLWLLTVTLVPSLVLFFGALFTSNNNTRHPEMFEIFGELLLFNLILVIVVASVILALSSISRKWMFAMAAWIGLVLVTGIIAGIAMDVTGEANWGLLGFYENILVVGRELYERKTVTDPEYHHSLLVLGGVVLASVGTYVWRILRLEVAE